MTVDPWQQLFLRRVTARIWLIVKYASTYTN